LLLACTVNGAVAKTVETTPPHSTDGTHITPHDYQRVLGGRWGTLETHDG